MGMANAIDTVAPIRPRGIVRYVPDDFVITAHGDTPLAAVEAVLRDHGQRLDFEPPSAGPLLADGPPTMATVAAMNLAGPRRPFSGDARDALIGVRLANADGDIIRAGGRTLKSVAGLDLGKVVAGSRGRFGKIVEVTFRVRARPETRCTLLVADTYVEAFPARVAKEMLAGLPVTGATHLSAGVADRLGLTPADTMLIRLEGPAPAVRAAAARFGQGATVVGNAASRDLWRAVGEATVMLPPAGGALWRVTVPPAEGGTLAAALQARGAETLTDWRGGLVWVRLDGAERTPILDVFAAHPSATARLVTGPAAATPPQAPTPALDALSEKLRQALDPAGSERAGIHQMGSAP